MPRISPAAALLLSASAVLFTSCRKPEIRVYLAPKDPPPPAQATAGHDEKPEEPAARPPARPKPTITFTKPESWTETAPGEISLAAFAIKGDGAEAAVNITPLPDLRGREALVVNMYRQQTGQPPIEQEELGKTLQPVEVAGGEGQMLELLGKNHDKPTRLITVIAHRDGRSWFYRLSGDDAFVTQQKEAFLAFLKTVQISEPEPTTESTPPPPAAAPAPATPEATPKAQP
ncbi:MAG: hypothetical protein WCF18_24210 [Chthoniobacteraceae bacterium]